MNEQTDQLILLIGRIKNNVFNRTVGRGIKKPMKKIYKRKIIPNLNLKPSTNKTN
jgi:hypothetical protein